MGTLKMDPNLQMKVSELFLSDDQIILGQGKRRAVGGDKYSLGAKYYAVPIFTGIVLLPVYACDQKSQDQNATTKCHIWHNIYTYFSISCGLF